VRDPSWGTSGGTSCKLWRDDAGVGDLALCFDVFLIGDGLATRPFGLEARYTREETERLDGAGDERPGSGGPLRYPRAAASAPFRCER